MTKLDRRLFLKNTIALSAGAWSALNFGTARSVLAQQSAATLPDLVAVKNGEPDVMFDQAIAQMGGISRFVKKGQVVIVKPNIGWNRGPETGANTHPLLVKRIVEQCVHAGAKKVYVFDNTVSWAWRAYKNSGIEAAAKEAGATIAPANNEKYYQKIDIPQAKLLKTAKAHELFLEADTVINVPVLKHHGSTRLTVAMKNLMGVVWDRRWYHNHGLHQSIADFCLYRKPDLNIVDAYRITMDNGPSRGRPEDLVMKKSLLMSTDIVSVDAAAAKLFGIEPKQVKYIGFGANQGIGKMQLKDLNIRRLSV